jgi:AraC family transcriptional regulator of adaptative response / DNA-3-methyladenine glycosylase II
VAHPRPGSGPAALLLGFRGPLAAAPLLEFLHDRALPGVEAGDATVHRRTLRLRHGPALAELQPARGHVRCLLRLADPRDRDEAVRRCRALLALDADARAADAHLARDRLLEPLVRAAPGLRVPGAADAHELAVRAVLGQQISVAGARTLAARLVDAHGEPVDERLAGPGWRLFPSARALCDLDPERQAMPRARGRTLLTLARALAAGEVRLDPDDRDASVAGLLELPGIGPWTAGYVALRALGDRDAFLATDLAVRRGMRNLGGPDAPAALAARAERWRPYRAHALAHLWRAA